MSFKIWSGGLETSDFIEEHLLGLRAPFLIYVRRKKCFVDFCAFNENSSSNIFGYNDLMMHEKEMKEQIDRFDEWGTGIFPLNNNKPHLTCHHRKRHRNRQNGISEIPESNEVRRLDSGRRGTHIKGNSFVKISLDARLSAGVVKTCINDHIFRRNFLQYVKSKCLVRKRKTKSVCDRLQDGVKKFDIPLVIVLKLTEPGKESFQLMWDDRIHSLVAKRGYLEDAMSWLNTLGGGYSALGDYFTYHAKEAGRISLRQMKVALEMGDPPTIMRCRLYFGLSLMQCGQLRRAKYIIRHQYRTAKKIASTDLRLQASCLGLWSRLGYLYHQRYLTRQKTTK